MEIGIPESSHLNIRSITPDCWNQVEAQCSKTNTMISLENAISDVLVSDSSDFYERDPETFFASQIGFCPRQLYLQKLGLIANDEQLGKFRITRMIQSYLEDQIEHLHQHLETKVSFHLEEDAIKFIGRCNLVDPEEGVVYALKTRNGWHKFSPPVERHLDQLHIYMQGTGMTQGKLVYISKNDLADVREWPAYDKTDSVITFDEERYDHLVSKARRIQEEIWSKGIATSPDEVPFQKCGCYFCMEESLEFPSSTEYATNSDDDSQSDKEEDVNSQEPTPDNSNRKPVKDGRYTKKIGNGHRASKTRNASTTVVHFDETHVPSDLKEMTVWVVWDGESKIARAPWQEGTMYPCEWAAGKEIDPRQSYEKANMVAELPPTEIHSAWPFPDGNDLPDQLMPAVLLPHNPPSPPLTFVDFDDVRNSETGEVSNEAVELVNMLGGYTEISMSGTGLHVYLKGSLPNHIGAFEEPLDDRGKLEIYDHSRFTGGTWRHLKGTPLDEVPECSDAIDKLVRRYG